MVDREGRHCHVDVDRHVTDLLIGLHQLSNLSGVDHLLGNLSVVLIYNLLKSLTGVDNSHLAIIVVKVLSDGLVVHSLNRGLCLRSLGYARLYTCELVSYVLHRGQERLSQTVEDRSCGSSVSF